MINGDSNGLGYGDRIGNPAPDQLVAQDQDLDSGHANITRRGSGVDKTNPFIGYFQTVGRGSPKVLPAPMSTPAAAGTMPSASTVHSGLLGSYQYSASGLFSQQKKITDWIGSQNQRLPPFFPRRDEKPPLSAAKKVAKRVVNVEDVEPTETAPVALFADYSMAPAVLTEDVKNQDEDDCKSNGKGILQLVKEEQDVGVRRRASSSSSEALSISSTSRFEQDFEIIGTLGEGGQGTVFKVRSKVDGCAYAIKKVIFPRSLQRDSVAFQQALREVKAMAGMGTHINVVRYHTAWLEEDIVECGPVGGDLKSDPENTDIAATVDDELASQYSFSHDSYSLSSLSQFDSSIGGFHFERSRSIIAEAEDELLKSVPRRPLAGVQEGACEDESESVSSMSNQPETQIVLYIQMELCGSAAVAPSGVEGEVEQEDSDSFQRLINRVTMKSTKKPAKKEADVHSTLSSWLRASVEARASPDDSRTKHQEGLKLLLGVVEGVQHMHECGVIHRDLKPDNIFIQGDVPKIGDFGLSKSITSDTHDIVKGSDYTHATGDDHTTALGTFTYASPEQLGYSWDRSKGTPSHLTKSAKYSIKSDIFALGIILLELCHPCSTMMERSQVLTGVRHGVLPQAALQRFPDEMALVLRMTSLDPSERPTTEEIIEQLRGLLATKESLSVRAALDDLRDLQQKLALAVLQLRDRSQTAQQLESLVAELSDKVHSVGLAIA
jgi:eukaryotic translation initiation factor 2-alpha kinase 1